MKGKKNYSRITTVRMCTLESIESYVLQRRLDIEEKLNAQRRTRLPYVALFTALW